MFIAVLSKYVTANIMFNAILSKYMTVDIMFINMISAYTYLFYLAHELKKKQLWNY